METSIFISYIHSDYILPFAHQPWLAGKSRPLILFSDFPVNQILDRRRVALVLHSAQQEKPPPYGLRDDISCLVGGLVAINVIFPFILGCSSSQLTNSYFSEGWVYNHQADVIGYEKISLGMGQNLSYFCLEGMNIHLPAILLWTEG